VFDLGGSRALIWYAMELHEGRTLEDVLADGPWALPYAELASRFADVAEALDAVHEAGLVHRDVKPSNLLLRPDERLVLADFGVVHWDEASTLTSTRDLPGTPAYMAPEQVRGDPPDTAADQYGLAACLYQAITGDWPLRHLGLKDVLAERSRLGLALPRTLRPDVPEALEAAVLRGLALEPGRYQVTVDDGQALFRAELRVDQGRRTVLALDELEPVTPEATVRRGDAEGGAEGDAPAGTSAGTPGEGDSSSEPEASPDDEYVTIPFNVGLLPPLSLNGADRSGKKVINTGSVALVWSRAARVDGIALALGGSQVYERMHGAQLAFGANLAGEVEGIQFSSGFNSAQRVRGVQASSVNHAKVVERGFQGGMVNVAGPMRGAQLGMLNVGGLVRGAQLSLLNVGGDVRGVQLGLINISRQADAAVGLLSITREGNVHPEVTVSDTAAVGVGLRFPARYTYSFIDVGVMPSGRGAGWQAGLGLGGRIRLPHDLFLDLDLAGYAVFRGLDELNGFDPMAKVRLTLAWQARPRLSVFGGPTLNVLAEIDSGETLHARPGLYQFDGVDVRERSGEFRIRAWPGFVAGVRF
ncbi:MAG: serine/threonine protein kinase, partial [Myxococcales bacterium]|nr:serine/threonine protein kinase [Myxococcales bacterium]